MQIDQLLAVGLTRHGGAVDQLEAQIGIGREQFGDLGLILRQPIVLKLPKYCVSAPFSPDIVLCEAISHLVTIKKILVQTRIKL